MLYILYDYFYPAYKAGGPIKSLVNLVAALQDQTGIRIVCSSTDLDGTELNTEKNKWLPYGNATIFYATNGFNGYKKQIKGKGNIFFINGMYSIQYNLLPALFLKGRKIVSVRGMLHTEAIGQKSFKKNLYLSVWKMLALHKKCEYHSTSEVETQHIKNRFGNTTRVWTIPNLPNIIDQQILPVKANGELILATVALISPMKNHLLVLGALKNCTSPITYNIYGPVKDEQYWEKCKKVIASLPSNITVEHHGEISPDKVVDAIAKCHVIIQPSKSENFGHSLLEAMMCGRPVITSTYTPWNKLKNNKAGVNVTIDNEQNIAAAINLFVEMNGEELSNWSNAARQYALSAIDTEKRKAEYLQMFTATN